MSYSETWVWNRDDCVLEIIDSDGISVDFKSNGILYHSISIQHSQDNQHVWLYYDNTVVAQIMKDIPLVIWNSENDVYRTMTFFEPITEESYPRLYYQFTEVGYNGEPSATKQETPPEPEPTPTFNITTAKLTPRSVYTNEPFVISIGFQELVTWLLDNNDTFLIDADSNYILTGD